MATAVGDTDAAPARPKLTRAWKKLVGRFPKLKDPARGRRIQTVRSGDTKSSTPIRDSVGASEAQQSSDPTSQDRLVQDTSRATLTASTSGLRASRVPVIVPTQVVGQTQSSGSRHPDDIKTKRRKDETSFSSSPISGSQQPTQAPDGK
jgi:hypothetical protein